MKTKAQKRLEAIQRLENPNPNVSWCLAGSPDGELYKEMRAKVITRRHAEAKRLRAVFQGRL